MNIEANAIQTEVRQHYSKAIRLAASSCCTNGAADRRRDLYGDGPIDQLPEGLATVSFGCGNPFLLANLAAGDFVLDLGSGAGLDVLLAAKLVGDHGRVYGLDMTDDMLEVAQDNARKAGARNVVFLRGEIESIPLPRASVDAIISNCVVNLAPDKRQAFAEAARVLKPGGRLAITDIVIDGDLDGLLLEEAQVRAGFSWAGCMAGAATTAALREYLAAAGFSDVRIEILRRYSRDTLRRGVPEAFVHLPDSAVDELLGRFASATIAAVKS